MEQQSYAKHAKLVPMYHGVLGIILLLTLIGSIVNLVESFGDKSRHYNAALIAVMMVALLFTALFARVFALKAQDRAIRAEESLRYFILTGKQVDPRLTIKQFIGLRFASDGEFVALAKRAAEEGLSSDDIKKSVKNWRPDFDRL